MTHLWRLLTVLLTVLQINSDDMTLINVIARLSHDRTLEKSRLHLKSKASAGTIVGGIFT
jgi:hypothetical protein